MGGSGWWLGRMHGGGIQRLHGQRGIVVEAIVVVDGGLVLRGVVGGAVMPVGSVVLEGVLVVLLVVHVHLAHGERWWAVVVQVEGRYAEHFRGRNRAGASLRDGDQRQVAGLAWGMGMNMGD